MWNKNNFKKPSKQSQGKLNNQNKKNNLNISVEVSVLKLSRISKCQTTSEKFEVLKISYICEKAKELTSFGSNAELCAFPIGSYFFVLGECHGIMDVPN